jgi:two-component system, chemotaxis family, chemotaxis protein CheY
MRILVVDDESVSRRKLQFIMKNFGRCDQVENGRQAVEAFVKAWEEWAPYDLIALDLVMPEMNGDDALLEIRALENRKNVPEDRRVKVIMITAQSNKDTIVTCVQLGCNDFISKPFDPQIVEEKLHKYFPQL